VSFPEIRQNLDAQNITEKIKSGKTNCPAEIGSMSLSRAAWFLISEKEEGMSEERQE
jgi:hypothetical protein